MDKREAKQLFERCLPKFVEAGLQVISEVSDVKVKEIASLWAGMGDLLEVVFSYCGGWNSAVLSGCRIEEVSIALLQQAPRSNRTLGHRFCSYVCGFKLHVS